MDKVLRIGKYAPIVLLLAACAATEQEKAAWAVWLAELAVEVALGFVK